MMQAYQIGNLVNLNELATQRGISRNTADQYLAILEKYCLIFRLPSFSTSQAPNTVGLLPYRPHMPFAYS
jgi:predicted AAA+ superfamily ATPase